MGTESNGRGTLLGFWGGFLLLALAACSAEAPGLEESESVGQGTDAIAGGWQTLTLKNGWQAFAAGLEPAVGIVDGIVTFKGALKATSPTSDIPFDLPSSFLPSPKSNVAMPIALSKSGLSGSYGTLFIDLNGKVHISEDGYAGSDTVGPRARAMSSLEGAAFDQVAGQLLPVVSGWEESYGTRVPPGDDEHPPALIKQVGAPSSSFVRFQGGITWAAEGYGGFIATIPTTGSLGFDARPSNTVFVPTHLGGLGSTGSWGLLTIHPSGDIYVNGNANASNDVTSFEGVFYSKNLNNQTLSLGQGWSAYSARSVRVGKYGDVVRFQGAIKGASNATTTIATLPSDFWPTRKVYVVAGVTYNTSPLPARLVIQTDGKVQVDDPGLTYAKQMLTLDGVSFGR